MIILDSIEIEGFKSFQNKQVFSFQRPCGLYYIRGDNRVEDLEGNGVGKSSLIDALTFVHWGKTVREVRANHVVNWASKTARVSLSYHDNTNSYILTRTQSPNSLLLTINGVERTVTESNLKLDFNKFLVCVIVGQLTSSFLDLTPTAQLDMFSSLMNLDLWETCSAEAKSSSDVLDLTIHRVESRRDANSERLQDLASQLSEISAHSKLFESNKKSQLEQLQSELDSNQTELNHIIIEIVNNEEELTKIVATITRLDEQLTTYRSDLSILKEELYAAHSARNNLDAKIADIKASYDKWKNLENTCPTCLQSVDWTIITNEKAKLAKKLSATRDQLKPVESRTTILGGNEVRLTTKGLELQASQNFQVSQRSSIEAKLSLLQRNSSEYKEEISRLKQALTDLHSGLNPHTKQLIRMEAEKQNLELRIIDANTELQDLRQRHAHVEFWIKGFKNLRLWLTAKALKALEAEANRALALLGLPRWSLRFEIERETASGSLSRGFHVFVSAPGSPPDVPYKLWSGGETQRLKLATTLGMAALIRAYTGFDCNVEFYDEPTEHMSDQGISDLISYLNSYAIQENKVIFFVDHKSISSEFFKEIITVIKDENGSRFA